MIVKAKNGNISFCHKPWQRLGILDTNQRSVKALGAKKRRIILVNFMYMYMSR